MERLREDILDLGQADGHVLIDGETGTGKTWWPMRCMRWARGAGKKFVLCPLRGQDEEDALGAALRPR
jgi:DNA-binding NtrC family response regulator